MCSDTITFDTLPAELLAKICQYFPRCDCDSEQASPSLLSLGCTGTHAPNLFTKSATLAQLRQTSRSLRNAALNRGLSQITGSSRWMRRRLHSIRELHGHRTRRLVFRSTDYVREGCSDSKTIMDQLEYFLAAQWPKLTAVAVEWFSGLTQDHEKIAELVQRHCGGRVRELFVRDKAVRLAAPGPWHNLAGIKRLAAVPYGYNRRWIDLQPAATVSDLYPVLASQESAGQLRALAVGGSDFSAALLQTLAQWQPLLNSLAVEHAWLEPLQSTQAKLSHVRRLHLEHVLADSTGLLPLTPQMFPKLETLTVRHVWTSAPRRSATARGAVSLQNPRWLVDGMLAHPWPCLTSLALPAITDDDAHALVKACPRLRRLATHSLDYSGPRLSAAGLAVLLSGLVDLQHLVIEQRRADGTPGYDVLDDALVRLLQQHRQRQQSVEIDADLEMVPLHRTASSTTTVAADSDMEDAGILCSAAAAAALAAAGSDTEVEIFDTFSPSQLIALPTTAIHSPPAPQRPSQLCSLVIPHMSFSSSTLDALLRQLPNVTRLSVSLRSERAEPAPFFKRRATTSSALTSSMVAAADQLNIQPAVVSLDKTSALRNISLIADEDVLTDPRWLANWLSTRFPHLRECHTNHARPHHRLVAALRDALPGVRLARLSSRALQATGN